MKGLKTLERLVGSTPAPPQEQTVAELEAARGAVALRLQALLKDAELVSGQICRNVGEWEGIRHVLASLVTKQRMAAGMEEEDAADEVKKELKDTRKEFQGLEAQLADLDTRRKARYAADRIEWNAQNADRQAELLRKLVAAIRAPAPFCDALEVLASEAAEIREWNKRIECHQPGGQRNTGLVEGRAQYIRTGDVAELADLAVVAHFKIHRVAPDRWR